MKFISFSSNSCANEKVVVFENVKDYFAPWYIENNKLIRLLCQIHLSQRTNKLINLPFKKLWNKRLFGNHFCNDEVVCFVVNAHFYWLEYMGAYDFIRKEYPNSFFILHFPDTYNYFITHCKNFPSVEHLKKTYDMVISYNTSDVEKYNLIQKPIFIKNFSKDYKNIELDLSIPESDVLFVGQDKGRLNALHEIYEKCTSYGLKCDFHIVGVEGKYQLKESNIEYNHFMSYEEILKRVKRTKCVLNYIYDGNGGVTMRDYEAIGNNKFLLTNNASIKNTELYDSEQIIWIEDLEINAERIKKGKQTPNKFKNVKNDETFYTWLEKKLKGKI